MPSAAPLPAHAVVADIGGTNARFAVADLQTLKFASVCHFPGSDYPTLAAAMTHYLSEMAERPNYAAIAVAAPITGEEVKLTNSQWSFAKSELCRAVGLKGVEVLNDFEALSLSLPHLDAGDLHQIGGGEPVAHATKAVLGPGTGLGVAGLVWSGTSWVAAPGEGGHMSLGAQSAAELALLERLRAGRDHLSVERALSGPGLTDLHMAVAASHGHSEAPLEPHEVVHRALSGEDEIAEEALDVFVAWLGRFAGDMALVFGARGGVYLGGGIPPKILSRLDHDDFRQAFEQKGRMKPFLVPIPVYVILAEFATLTGAAAGLRASLAAGGAGLARP
jgi:glucokinase